MLYLLNFSLLMIGMNMFKNISIYKKIFYPIIVIAFISTIIFLYSSYNAYKKVKHIILENKKSYLSEKYLNYVYSEMQKVSDVALVLADNKELCEAVTLNNRLISFKILDRIIQNFYKNKDEHYQIEIVTPSLNTFLKTWNYNSFNDSLPKINKSFNYVNQSKKIISNVEIGERGLAATGVTPLYYSEEYTGMIKVIYDFNEIIKSFPDKNIKLLIFSPEKYAKKAGINNFNVTFSDNKKFSLVVSNAFIDLNFLDTIKNLAGKIILKEKTMLTDNYYITIVPLKDYFNNTVAWTIMGMNVKVVLSEIADGKTAILQQIIVIGISSITLFLVILFILFNGVVNPIRVLSNEISERDIKNPKKIEMDRNDEIGILAKYFNKYLESINRLLYNETKINQFRKLIEDDKTLEEVYERLKNLFDNYFKFKRYVFYEINPSGNRLTPVINIEEDDGHTNREIFSNADLCRCKRVGSIISSDDSFFDNTCHLTIEKFFICVPLISGEGVKNILHLKADNEEEFKKIKSQLKDLQLYLQNVSPVLETKRLLILLKKESVTDTLTGFYNRRFLDSYIQKEVAFAKRNSTKIGILMLDIDFFKKVNDQYGHDVGDTVLREIAHLILKEIRESDIPVRFGGEEFLVILNNLESVQKVAEIAERIRKSVEETPIKTGIYTINKTISIGYAIFDDDADEIWRVIKFSDIALYEAKRTGRNKVVKFTKDMWSEEDY